MYGLWPDALDRRVSIMSPHEGVDVPEGRFDAAVCNKAGLGPRACQKIKETWSTSKKACPLPTPVRLSPHLTLAQLTYARIGSAG